MLPFSVIRLLAEAVCQQRALVRRNNHIGPGRVTLHTWHRAAAKGRNYGVSSHGGKRECARRLRRGDSYDRSYGPLAARG